MRQHKYRIWDNLKKEWLKKKVYHASITLDANGIGEFSFKQHPEGYTIQQYIGLKDKNGKEIYEGDICSFSDWKLKPIVWRDGFFRLGNTDVLCCKMECDNMEVIGNIFENPDLLK